MRFPTLYAAETDSRTLEDIEMFYSRPGFRFFYRNIEHVKHEHEISQGCVNDAFSKL